MIYIAAPLFSEMERDYIDKIVDIICDELELDSWDDFYLPHRDNKYGDCFESDIYDENMKYLNKCGIMIAILDGKDVDSGTAFEIGYFAAQDKPVLGLLTDERSYDNNELNKKLNTMVYGACVCGELVFNNIDDLIDELYYYLTED